MSDTANEKTVFVAGGAKGIGKGIVTALAEEGYDITFSYRGSADEAAQLVEALRARHPSQAISSVQVDLSVRDEVDGFAGLIGQSESLYGLVYNAGGSYDTLAVLAAMVRAGRGSPASMPAKARPAMRG